MTRPKRKPLAWWRSSAWAIWLKRRRMRRHPRVRTVVKIQGKQGSHP